MSLPLDSNPTAPAMGPTTSVVSDGHLHQPGSTFRVEPVVDPSVAYGHPAHVTQVDGTKGLDPAGQHPYPAHADEKLPLGLTATEQGSASPTQGATVVEPRRSKWRVFYARYRIVFHGLIWLLFTGYAAKLSAGPYRGPC